MDLLAHLEAYVAVCEERSFSRAADVLDIAQPLLSRRIKTLEQHLGGELFDRTRRQIETTDLGVLLLPYATDVLGRAEHLREVARSARESVVRAIGVPPDCDPAALARVIRAGSEHGLAVGVHELPAAARAAGLDDGSLAFALLRVPPEAATFRLPLGLASATPLASTTGGRPVHLEDLRPRRGPGRGKGPVVLTLPEDDVPFAADRFRKAAAKAGLPEGQSRTTSSTAAALAETLAGNGLLLCTEPFARRHQVPWAPLADTALHRGYELAAAPGRHGGVPPDWLAVLLGAAIGTRTGAVPGARPTGDGPRTTARLAARG